MVTDIDLEIKHVGRHDAGELVDVKNPTAIVNQLNYAGNRKGNLCTASVRLHAKCVEKTQTSAARK